MYRLALVVLAAPLVLFALADAEKAGPTLVGGKPTLKPIVTGLKNPESVVHRRATAGSTSPASASSTRTATAPSSSSRTARPCPSPPASTTPRASSPSAPTCSSPTRRASGASTPRARPTVHVAAKAFPDEADLPQRHRERRQGHPLRLRLRRHQGQARRDLQDRPRRARSRRSSPQTTTPEVGSVNGLRLVSEYHLLAFNLGAGHLLRVRLADGKVEKLAEGMVGGDGITFDHFGRLYLTSWAQGKVWGIPRPGDKPVLHRLRLPVRRRPVPRPRTARASSCPT